MIKRILSICPSIRYNRFKDPILRKNGMAKKRILSDRGQIKRRLNKIRNPSIAKYKSARQEKTPNPVAKIKLKTINLNFRNKTLKN